METHFSTFFDNLDSFAEASAGIAKLRELILDLAVRGKLVEQDENDEPASELLKRVDAERTRLVKEKQLRKRRIPPPPNTDEIPHELPNGWEWTRLSIIGEVGPRNYIDDFTEVSFLPMATISDGYAGTIGPKVRKWGEIKKGFTHVADGDIAMAKITPCFQNRKSAVMRGLQNGVGAGTTELHVLRPIDDAIVPEYALLHLKSLTYLEVGVSKMTGSAGQKRVPKDYFADTPFPLPPLSEQRRIVSKVDGLMSLCDELESRGSERVRLREQASRSCLDRLVESSSANDLSSAWQRLSDHFEVLYDTPETLAHLRQSILQLAVQGKLVPQDPNDEPASIVLARLRDRTNALINAGELKKPKTVLPLELNGNEGMLPDSWVWAQLSDILRYGPRNGYSPRPVDYETPVKSLTLSATTSGTFNGRYTKYIDHEVAADSHLWLVDGDILIQRSNSLDYVGVTAIYRGPSHEFIYPDLMMKFRVDDEIEPDFMQIVLRSQQSRTFFQTRATGTSGSMRKINQSIVVSLPIPLPPLAEQERIVAKVDQLLSECDELSARLRERQSTTEQLLTATIHHLLDNVD